MKKAIFALLAVPVALVASAQDVKFARVGQINVVITGGNPDFVKVPQARTLVAEAPSGSNLCN